MFGCCEVITTFDIKKDGVPHSKPLLLTIMSQFKRISQVIKTLGLIGIPVTVENVITQSLFSVGGTVSDSRLLRAMVAYHNFSLLALIKANPNASVIIITWLVVNCLAAWINGGFDYATVFFSSFLTLMFGFRLIGSSETSNS